MKTATLGLVLAAAAWLAVSAATAGEALLPVDGSAAAIPMAAPPGSNGAVFTGLPMYSLPPTLQGPGGNMVSPPMAMPRNEPPSLAEPGFITAPGMPGPGILIDPATGLPAVPPSEACLGEASPEAKPSDIRNGFFQKAIFDATWLPRQGSAGLGMTDLEVKLAVALPLPTTDWPIVIVPGFAEHDLDAPTAQLPPHVYDAYVLFRWLPKLSQQWLLDLAVTPGVYSDFQQSADHGWRTTAHAAAVYTWSPTLKAVGGVLYLERRDDNFSPVAGVLWTPSDDWDVEILYPAPKVAYRISATTGAETVEDWIYATAEFADSIWAVQRTDGVEDRVAYEDYRFILGLEHKHFQCLSGKLEVGYVFNRKLFYYDNTIPTLYPPGTLMLRGEVRY